jgi:23S rRNA pseudouridine1911/1915/1917 synthase
VSRRERFVVGAADAGLRLDQLLAARIPDLSRRKARTLLDIGGVFVDGARVKVAGRTLRRGQKVEVHLGGALERAAAGVGGQARARDAAGLPEPRVVFEDADLWVIDKPAGLLTAPTPESDRGNLADLLSRRPGAPRALVVHRLDLGTSGLLVMAKTELANRALAERFRVHDVTRSYEAVVAGAFPVAVERVEEPVAGKRAVTRFQVLERFGVAATRLGCTLETGRTHQIRLHTLHVGHPVLGDARYGAEPSAALPPAPRMALHARTLGFVHPRSGESLSFESEWPAEMIAWLEALRVGSVVAEP